jgi:DNA-binding transcriptional ArsR family regulator
MLKQKSVQEKTEFFFHQKRNCEKLLGLFSLLANENRFKIICTLNEQEFCVNDLVKITGGKPSNISQQLKILTLAGFLERERRGKLIYYSLKDDKLRKLLDFLFDQYGSKKSINN